MLERSGRKITPATAPPSMQALSSPIGTKFGVPCEGQGGRGRGELWMRRPRTYLLFNILGLMLKHLSSSPALAFAPPAIRTASAATFPQTIRDPILRPLAQSTLRCSGSPASGRRDLAPQVGRGLAVHGFGAHTNLARVPVLSGVWSARRAVASPASLHQGKSGERDPLRAPF